MIKNCFCAEAAQVGTGQRPALGGDQATAQGCESPIYLDFSPKQRDSGHFPPRAIPGTGATLLDSSV